MGSVMIGPGERVPDQQALDLFSEGGLTVEQVLQYIGGFFSSSFAAIVKYASLLAGVGMLVLFWFYRLSEVQIASPGTAIKGNPKSYEEGRQFCYRLLTVVEEKPAAAQREEPLKTTALILACVLSRWSGVLAIFLFPYARKDGKARVFTEGMFID